MGQPYAAAGIEPPIEELLDDEIARLVMRRDGLEPADVWRWVEEARSHLGRIAASPAAAEPRRGEADLGPGLGD